MYVRLAIELVQKLDMEEERERERSAFDGSDASPGGEKTKGSLNEP